MRIILMLCIPFLYSCMQKDLNQELIPATRLKILFIENQGKDSLLIKSKTIINEISTYLIISPSCDEINPKDPNICLFFSHKGNEFKNINIDMKAQEPYGWFEENGQVFCVYLTAEGVEFFQSLQKYHYVPQNPY